jgi:hypothetical protein
VQTALAQIVAEELDVPFGRVRIVEGDTALTPDQGPTFGSLSIQVGGMQIRNAAARAKSALIELAAAHLGIKPDELTVANGIVSGGGKQVSYGELIGGKTFSLTLDHQKPPATKDAKAYKIVGTSVPRRLTTPRSSRQDAHPPIDDRYPWSPSCAIWSRIGRLAKSSWREDRCDTRLCAIEARCNYAAIGEWKRQADVDAAFQASSIAAPQFGGPLTQLMRRKIDDEVRGRRSFRGRRFDRLGLPPVRFTMALQH